MGIQVDRSSRLLFIGDSITDCGRGADPDGIGQGYVRLVRDYLLAKDPGRAPTMINRGLSGNKVTDLASRWEPDVLTMSPTVVSILVGVNDVWHGLAPGGVGVPVDEYGRVYGEILRALRARIPDCQVVLCEPTVIWPPQDARGRRFCSRMFGWCMIWPGGSNVRAWSGSMGRLRRRGRRGPMWCGQPDGVHPSSAGHMLIARTWLQTTGLL